MMKNEVKFSMVAKMWRATERRLTSVYDEVVMGMRRVSSLILTRTIFCKGQLEFRQRESGDRRAPVDLPSESCSRSL